MKHLSKIISEGSLNQIFLWICLITLSTTSSAHAYGGYRYVRVFRFGGWGGGWRAPYYNCGGGSGGRVVRVKKVVRYGN